MSPFAFIGITASATNPDPTGLGILWHTVYMAGPTCLDSGGAACSDGEEVYNWSDQSGNNRTATRTSNGPAYVAADAAYNNRPTVSFDGSDDLLTTSAFTLLAQPLTIVVIGNPAGLGTNKELRIDGDSGQDNRCFIGLTFSGALQGGAPTLRTESVLGAAEAAFFGAVFNDASSKWFHRGNTYTKSPGTQGLKRLCIGGEATTPYYAIGKAAFVGVFDGDLTAHAQWSNLKTWANTIYGVNVS